MNIIKTMELRKLVYPLNIIEITIPWIFSTFFLIIRTLRVSAFSNFPQMHQNAQSSN